MCRLNFTLMYLFHYVAFTQFFMQYTCGLFQFGVIANHTAVSTIELVSLDI